MINNYTMQNYKCTRCGNTIMLGQYKGEVCPLDQGTLVLATSCGNSFTKTSPLEHANSDANTKAKNQVLLNE